METYMLGYFKKLYPTTYFLRKKIFILFFISKNKFLKHNQKCPKVLLIDSRIEAGRLRTAETQHVYSASLFVGPGFNPHPERMMPRPSSSKIVLFVCANFIELGFFTCHLVEAAEFSPFHQLR